MRKGELEQARGGPGTHIEKHKWSTICNGEDFAAER